MRREGRRVHDHLTITSALRPMWVEYTFLEWASGQLVTACPRHSGSKESSCNAGDVGSIPKSGRSMEKGMTTHSSVLAWRIPWTAEPGGLQSMGSQRVRHDWVTNTLCLKDSSEGRADNRAVQARGVYLSSLLPCSTTQVQFSSVQSFSPVRFPATPWTAAPKASLSFTISQSLLKRQYIKSVMPSNHLILCHPLLLLPSVLPSIRDFSNKSVLHIRWPKYPSFSISISPSNEYSRLISFRMDWLYLLAVQGTLKTLLQHHSLKASILRCSAFFIVQLPHPYVTTGKTIALTRWTFVGKVMSLLFNMLSRLVIAFLPRSKHLLISWLQSSSAVIMKPPKIKSFTVSIVFPSICQEVMGPNVTIFVFWMLSLKPAFSLSSFTFIKRFFSSSSLSAIMVVLSAYMRLLIFLPAILIPACASTSPAFCNMYSAYKLNKQGDNIQPWRSPFPNWNQSTVPGMLLDLHTDFSGGRLGGLKFPSLYRNFPQFVVIHTVKGFGIVNKAEIDGFLELSCLFDDPTDVGNLISSSSAFKVQLEHLEILGCWCTVEAWLGEFWALLC